MITALSAGYIKPILFAMLTLTSGPLFVCSGVGNISWNGQTWLGLGPFLSVGLTEDGSTVQARGINLIFSGCDTTMLTDCLSDYKVGLPVALYLGAYASDGSIVSDPLVAWAGRLDQPTIDVDGPKATISIACENRLVDMNIAVQRRWTNEDQQKDVPGDLAFSFVDQLQEKTLFWGRFPNSTNNI
jgi:hypothetical protein